MHVSRDMKLNFQVKCIFYYLYYMAMVPFGWIRDSPKYFNTQFENCYIKIIYRTKNILNK